MADQELGIRMKTDSDVPEAMGKARNATVSFQKQVEDIGKKFSTAFKDIFLGFTAPMVILQSIIGFIQNSIEESKRQAKEGFDLIAQGDTLFASSNEKRFAAYLKFRKAQEDEMEAVKKGKIEVSQRFAETPEGGKLGIQLAQKYNVAPEGMNAFFKNLSNIPEFQKKAMDWFLNSPEAQKFVSENAQQKGATSFQSPAGVNAVVGMGNNAAMQAMLDQLEEQRKQTALLEQIAQSGGNLPSDFTKPTAIAAPSRSYLLKK